MASLHQHIAGLRADTMDTNNDDRNQIEIRLFWYQSQTSKTPGVYLKAKLLACKSTCWDSQMELFPALIFPLAFIDYPLWNDIAVT